MEPLVGFLAMPSPPNWLVQSNDNSNLSYSSARRSLPSLYSHLRMDQQASLPPRRQGASCSYTPFSLSLDDQSQRQQYQQQKQDIDDGIGSFASLSFDGSSSLTSPLLSTTRPTQDLVAAAQPAMCEVVGRCAPYAERGVRAFGGERSV